MGVKDQGLQEYLKDSERFADFVNGTLFAGEQIIDASYLEEAQRKKRVSYKQRIVVNDVQKKKVIQKDNYRETNFEKKGSEEKYFSGETSKLMYLERERDFLRLYNKPDCKLLLACEAETRADYEMPVRCFTYDSIEYTDQLKTWKQRNGRKHKNKRRRTRRPLIPVFHMVLYLGQERWRSKHRLQEMMDIPEKVKRFADKLPEYDIGMIDIHEQNPELFHTEWSDIFRLMRHSRKKEDLKKYIEDNHEEIQKLSEETRLFLAILLEQYTIIDDRIVEVKDMCKAWDGAMQMYADEAREATKKEMQKEMQKQAEAKDRKTVFNMFSRGYSLAEIALISELPLVRVQELCAGFSR